MATGPGTYLKAAFGGIDLLITNIETEFGRDVVVQSPARGDRHVQQDRGQRLVSTTCTILFVDQPGKPPHFARFSQFYDLANAEGVSPFTHPLLGSYLARVTDVSLTAEEGTSQISCSAKFLAENEPEVVLRGGAGITPIAGVEAVTASLEIAGSTAADLGLRLELPDIVTQVTDWASGNDPDSQSVFAQVASISGAIDGAMRDLELTTDLSRWQLYRALVLLKSQVVSAAEAVTADAQVLDITLTIPRPLLAVCAELYGATLASTRADQVTKLNRVRTPGLVPPGVYKFPSDGARA